MIINKKDNNMSFINWGNESPEQLRLRRKFEEEQAIFEQRAAAMSAAAAATGSGRLRSGSFQFVANTSDNTEFTMIITVDSDTSYTYIAGNGDTITGELLVGQTTLSYEYGEEASDFQAKLNVENPNAVTELRISSDRISAFSNVQVFPNLTYVDFDNNYLVEADFSGLANLRYLDISDTNLPGQFEHSLALINLTGCSNLEELRADDSDFSAGFDESLIGISQCTELFHLDLDDCNLSGSIDLSSLSSLKFLDLSVNSEITEVIISNSQPLGEGGRSVNINGAGLTQESVDAILVALSENGVTDGNFVNLADGTSAAPSETGLAAKAVLESNGWAVFVNEPPPGTATIAPSTDFDIVGDFTIEMFVSLDSLTGNIRPYSFGTYPNAANAISLEGGTIYFWANGAFRSFGPFSPSVGQWYHICVMRSGTDISVFVNGNEIASYTYPDPIPSQGLPLTIGNENAPNTSLNGFISNFRWTSSAVYTVGGFVAPSAPLTDLPDTKLLIFQGTSLNAQLTDNSGNGNNAFGSGSIAYSTDDPFGSLEGSTQLGTV